MRQIVYLVTQNLKRKRFRTVVMIGSIVLACATIIMAIILSQGIQHTLQTARQRLGADIVAVPFDATEEAESALISGNPTAFYMPSGMEARVAQVAGVARTSPQVFLRSLDAPCCVAQVALVGYDPARDLTINHWNLQKTREPLQDNQIIVGAKVISAVVGTPQQAIGQRLIFMGKPFSVAMILEPTGLGTDYTVFVTLDTAYRLTQDSPLYPVPVKADQISTILVKTSDNENPAAVARRIEESIPELKTLTANQLTRSVNRQMEGLVDILFVAGAIFCVLAAVLAGSLFMLSVRQRMREFGLFRAMGARRSVIIRLIVLEAICIAGAGAVLGVLLGVGIAFLGKGFITGMVGNAYMWPEPAYFVKACLACVAVAIVSGMVGGLYPALRISAVEPYQAIRKGE